MRLHPRSMLDSQNVYSLDTSGVKEIIPDQRYNVDVV